MHITEVEREMAVDCLVRYLPPATLKRLIPPNIRRLVSEVEEEASQSQAREMAEFLVDLYGPDLLAKGDIREQLCQRLDRNTLLTLRDAAQIETFRSRKQLAHMIAQRRWHPGKWWARVFAASIGMPPVFAGNPGDPPPPPYEDVEAYESLPPLYDYQKKLHDQVVELFRAPAHANRAILSLPTGAGKTRTVVEALITALIEGVLKGGLILWIAQSDELCEQAIGTFRRVWLMRGKKGEVLRLYRVWGGRPLPETVESGVLVASIQKLYQAVRHPEEHEQVLANWSRLLGAVVIDEAHHALAPSYTAVLEALGYRSGRRDTGPAPLLGLTATPYRSASETPLLARRFQGRLLTPWPATVNPIIELQSRGILARIEHEVVPTHTACEMTEAERAHFQTFAELAESFVKRIGLDPSRNQVILGRLLRLDPSWPVLFFGCSKEHATAMALLLRRRGVSAAVVTAETARATRRAIVEDFRSGRIRVLCNYGIFTTGFDAPNVRAVVVARPTTSVVLYEQMIGRGMRGPRNGGTSDCLVIDFSDNLERFGVQMAYTRFVEYWQPRGLVQSS